MLLELYDFGLETRTLQVIAGLVLGLLFGIAAQISRFCLRRAVAGPVSERSGAGAVWTMALLVAIIAFSVAQYLGLVSLEGHRFASTQLPLAALIVGGLAFGLGMVLTRGCASRLTVLSVTGNLRALTVLLVFAVIAHATLKGVFAPIRTTLGAWTVELPFASLSQSPFALASLGALTLVGFIVLQSRARANFGSLAMGAVIGLVAVGGWVSTSVLLMDEFDPLPVQSAAFTLPWTDGLFWAIASSSIPAGFAVGFLGGVLGGSFLSAAARGELEWQSFSTPQETLRYVLGGSLMGVGGVLAGGCTVGAGLSGVASGSIAAIVVLCAIVLGAGLAAKIMDMNLRALPAAA